MTIQDITTPEQRIVAKDVVGMDQPAKARRRSLLIACGAHFKIGGITYKHM
ncbi:hypothetical protein ACVMIH_007460 [Bradyrhizobium sp. USDA 4503]